MTTPLDGLTFTMGRKGMVDCEKELPEHFIFPEMLGNTSVSSSYSFTFDWIVWFSLTFLSKVF
jgi:hypothetical protein